MEFKKKNTSNYSAAGSISRSPRNYLSNMPGKNCIKYVNTENKHTGHFACHSEGTNLQRRAFIKGNSTWHVCGIGEAHAGIWWGDVKVRNHLEDLGADGTLILKWVSNESFRRAWIR